jgi:hypothetical protein
MADENQVNYANTNVVGYESGLDPRGQAYARNPQSIKITPAGQGVSPLPFYSNLNQFQNFMESLTNGTNINIILPKPGSYTYNGNNYMVDENSNITRIDANGTQTIVYQPRRSVGGRRKSSKKRRRGKNLTRRYIKRRRGRLTRRGYIAKYPSRN